MPDANADADELHFSALAAGLSLSADGKTLAVANMQNDSVSLIDTQTRKVYREVPLHRPGSLLARGEYPYGVAIWSNSLGMMNKTYVSSLRDGDVTLVQLLEGEAVARNIELGGEPNALLLSPDGSTLYAANGDLDEIDVIDTKSERLIRRISVDRSAQRYRGANPNALALDDRAQRLYVTLGGENAVAVIDLKAYARHRSHPNRLVSHGGRNYPRPPRDHRCKITLGTKSRIGDAALKCAA